MVLSFWHNTRNKGKGQQGNSWESEAGKNLLASIILFPNFFSAGKQFYLSKIASLAIVDFLKSETNGISIKWPNDIYIQDKKVAGILIENAIKGQNYFHFNNWYWIEFKPGIICF